MSEVVRHSDYVDEMNERRVHEACEVDETLNPNVEERPSGLIERALGETSVGACSSAEDPYSQ